MCCSLGGCCGRGVVAAELGIRPAPGRFLAAGSPIGVPRFIREHAHQCAEEARPLVDTLDQLKLPSQEHWLLLHGSRQLRMAHLPQVAEWDSIGNAVLATEDRMVDSAFKLMCCAQQDGAVLKQMTLP